MPIIVGSGGSGSAAAGLSNYAELVASIGSWLNRDDLNDLAPDLIRLCEVELNRILRVPEMEAEETLSVASGSASVPDDFLEVRHLYVDGDIDNEIIPSSFSIMRRDYPVDAATGRPQLYTLRNGTLLFAPAPDTTYSVQLEYFQKIPALTSDDDTNWVLDDHPDIYLFGSLCMAEAHLWNDERIPLWRNAFDNAVSQLKRQGTFKRHGGGPLAPRPLPRPAGRS